MMDVENDYFEKDDLVEGVVEEMVIQVGDDEDETVEEDEYDMIDSDDRRVNDQALQQETMAYSPSTSNSASTSTDTQTTPTHTGQRQPTFTQRQLTEQYDTQFLRGVLPLHLISQDPHSTLPGQVPGPSGSSDLQGLTTLSLVICHV